MKRVTLIAALPLVLIMAFFSFGRKSRPSFEEQVATLENLGIRLRPGMTPESLLVSYGKDAYEEHPYELLLVVMGDYLEQDPFDQRLSDDIWHFDTEAIEDHGSYVAIAERIHELADGDLPLEAISDYVDIDEGVAWLSFRLNGEEYKWDLKVEDDWVDTDIFAKFDKLLSATGSKRRLTYYDLKGQDCLIGCGTPEHLQALRKKTGLDFVWMVQ